MYVMMSFSCMLNYKFHTNMLLLSMFTYISIYGVCVYFKEHRKVIMYHIVSVVSSSCPAHENIPDIQGCEGSDT